MSQMNVSITDHLAKYVQARVKSGRFNNASEVVREALRRMEEEEQRVERMAAPTVADVLTDLSAFEKERIRRRILKSIEEIERGEYTEIKSQADLDAFFEDIKARGRRRLKRLSEK